MHSLASKIDSVTVFRSGAQVTRVADLHPGPDGLPAEVRFMDLPIGLDDGSLRIRASFPEGGGGVLATDLRLDLDWPWTPPAEEPAEQREGLQKKRMRLSTELNLLREDVQRISQLDSPSRPALPAGQSPVSFDVASRRKLIGLRQEQLAKLNARLLEVTTELENVELELAKLDKAREERRNPPSEKTLRKAVIVGLRTTPEGPPPVVRLHLTYNVAGARWAPSYTIRFDRDLTMAELSMRAAVCQSSGEDWKNVELSVSTADPATWKDLPELPARRIGRAQQSLKRPGWRPPPLGTDALFADFDRGPSRPEAPASPSVDFQPFVPPPAEPMMAMEEAFPVMQADAFAPDVDEPFGSQAPGTDFELGYSAAPAPVMDLFAGGGALGAAAPAPPPPPPRASAPAAGLARRAMPSRPLETARSGMMKKESDRPVFERTRERRDSSKGALIQQRPRRWDEARAELAPWTGVEVGSEQLAYGLLRMPGPDEPGRGHLQPQTPLLACLRVWRARHPEATVDPAPYIEQALRASEQALRKSAPPAHRYPDAITGFDYLYQGETRVDLPSDVQFHNLPVLARQLSTHLQFVSVPRVSNDVFRQAEVETLPDLALPAGPVDVFVGKDYLLTSNLLDVAPGGSVKLGLGVEQGVKVVRNTSFKETVAGMMGGTLVLRHTIDVEAANRLDREVRLEVREAVPTAPKEQEEIKVKIETADPPWEPFGTNPDSGQHRWVVRVPAGAKTALKAVYLIEMPAKLELVGGNRREDA